MADEEAWQAQLRDHRQHLVEALHQASQDFDKAILTLAAGALGVSIAFVHDVAPTPRFKTVLALSWLLLAASLVLILLSFIASQKAIRWEIDHVYEEERADRPNPRRVQRLNVSSAGAFVAGVVTLAGFALLNLGGMK